MKITHIIAAGLLVAGLGTGASAQSHQRDDHRAGYSQQDRGEHREIRRDRDDRRSYHSREYRHDRGRHYGEVRGRHYGWNRHHRVRCTTTWRHHQRVRICR